MLTKIHYTVMRIVNNSLITLNKWRTAISIGVQHNHRLDINTANRRSGQSVCRLYCESSIYTVHCTIQVHSTTYHSTREAGRAVLQTPALRVELTLQFSGALAAESGAVGHYSCSTGRLDKAEPTDHTQWSVLRVGTTTRQVLLLTTTGS